METENESCSSFALKGQMQPSSRCSGWKDDNMGWLPGFSSLAQEAVKLLPQETGGCLSSFLFFFIFPFCDSLLSGCEVLGFVHLFVSQLIILHGLSGFIFWFFLSVSICIICYMHWLPNVLSQLIVAPGSFHLSQRFYKFRNAAPLAISEILQIIFGGLLYQCQELRKCGILAVIYNV